MEMTQRKTIVDGEKERPQNEEVITIFLEKAMTRRKTMGAMVKKNETEEVIISELLLAADKYNILGLLDVWFQKWK